MRITHCACGALLRSGDVGGVRTVCSWCKLDRARKYRRVHHDELLVKRRLWRRANGSREAAHKRKWYREKMVVMRAAKDAVFADALRNPRKYLARASKKERQV